MNLSLFCLFYTLYIYSATLSTGRVNVINAFAFQHPDGIQRNNENGCKLSSMIKPMEILKASKVSVDIVDILISTRLLRGCGRSAAVVVN